MAKLPKYTRYGFVLLVVGAPLILMLVNMYYSQKGTSAPEISQSIRWIWFISAHVVAFLTAWSVIGQVLEQPWKDDEWFYLIRAQFRFAQMIVFGLTASLAIGGFALAPQYWSGLGMFTLLFAALTGWLLCYYTRRPSWV